MNLSEIAADVKAHFESAEADAQKFLAEHVPGIAAVAAQIESDPLVQAAISTVLPAGWKTIAAEFITKLEGLATEAEQAKESAAAQAAADATAAAQAAAAAPAEAPAEAEPEVPAEAEQVAS